MKISFVEDLLFAYQSGTLSLDLDSIYYKNRYLSMLNIKEKINNEKKLKEQNIKALINR